MAVASFLGMSLEVLSLNTGLFSPQLAQNC